MEAIVNSDKNPTAVKIIAIKNEYEIGIEKTTEQEIIKNMGKKKMVVVFISAISDK
ncbi:hypothetical protein D3C73_1610430 [compost metagenome]